MRYSDGVMPIVLRNAAANLLALSYPTQQPTSAMLFPRSLLSISAARFMRQVVTHAPIVEPVID